MSVSGISSADADYLFRLLPPELQARDLMSGQALRALLRILGEQFGLIEDDIAQLYDNWFIETCDPRMAWLVGGPVGYAPASELVSQVSATSDVARDRLRSLRLMPRREVANLLRSRRRKGTPGVLETLARDVAGYPARVVEFRTRVLAVPHVNHPQPERNRVPSARQGDAIDRGVGPFSTVPRTPDARRLGSRRTPGRGNLNSVGVYVWRLRSYRVKDAPAGELLNPHPQQICQHDLIRHFYTFSMLQNNVRLFQRPAAIPDSTRSTTEAELPVPIRRRAFQDRLADFYGPEKSLLIWRQGASEPTRRTVKLSEIRAVNLSQPDAIRRLTLDGEVAIDPVIGRIVLDARELTRLWVSYHYGFLDDLGGGDYYRCLDRGTDKHTRHLFVRAYHDEDDSRDSIPEQTKAGEPYPSLEKALKDAAADSTWLYLVVEILDNAPHRLKVPIQLGAGRVVEIRAGQGYRPLVRLPEWKPGGPGNVVAPKGKPAGGSLILDGLLLASGPLIVEGAIDAVAIRHCTLVPGLSLNPDGSPRAAGTPSILWRNPGSRSRLTIDHGIVGPISVQTQDRSGDPLTLLIRDSILDNAGGQCEAIGGQDCAFAYLRLSIWRSTVFGKVQVHLLERGEDCIFRDPVQVARRQRGCLRFCYVGDDCQQSRTPPRFQCQPDLAKQQCRQSTGTKQPPDGAEQPADTGPSDCCPCCNGAIEPVFRSTRYGDPEYANLDAVLCPVEIRRGASDNSEMGVYHDLDAERRHDHLRDRLDEFSPLDVEVLPFFLTLEQQDRKP